MPSAWTAGGTHGTDGVEQKSSAANSSGAGSPADMLRRRLLGHHALAMKNAKANTEASTLAQDVDALRVKKEELAVQVETLQEDLEKQMKSYLTTLEDRAEAIEKANDVKYAAIEVQALRKKITSDGSAAASAFAATSAGGKNQRGERRAQRRRRKSRTAKRASRLSDAPLRGGGRFGRFHRR